MKNAHPADQAVRSPVSYSSWVLVTIGTQELDCIVLVHMEWVILCTAVSQKSTHAPAKEHPPAKEHLPAKEHPPPPGSVSCTGSI